MLSNDSKNTSSPFIDLNVGKFSWLGCQQAFANAIEAFASVSEAIASAGDWFASTSECSLVRAKVRFGCEPETFEGAPAKQ
ncbi:hypothetical protein R1flu_008338 [Riccia fluitans]|uniref:Uncharacterized protein n=1 Tax=Riccia fluitans TaxID=41844 RepID=A0ABD1YBM4_9MARC